MKAILILMFLVLAPNLESNPWVLQTESKDIKAFARIKSGTDYYEFKTILNSNSSIEKLIDLLMDVSSFKDWLPSTSDSRVLKRKSKEELIGYTVSTLPWPMSSRDLVFNMRLNRKNSNYATITLTGIENYKVLNDNFVRVKNYKATWVISKEGSKTSITHYVSFDPDSNVSKWMLKNSMITARVDVLKALKKELEK